MVIIKFVLLILPFSLIAFFINCLFPIFYLCPKFTKWTFFAFSLFLFMSKIYKMDIFGIYIYRLNPCIFNLSLIKYPWLFIFFKLNLLGYLCPKFTKWTILPFSYFYLCPKFTKWTILPFSYFAFWTFCTNFSILSFPLFPFLETFGNFCNIYRIYPLFSIFL